MVEQAHRINALITDPIKVNTASLSLLQQCIAQYPYFQAARSLYLKGLKLESSPLYNKELQITASHTADRSVLFDYITSAFFTQNTTSEYIKQQLDVLSDIDVESELVTITTTDLNEHITQPVDADQFIRKTDIVDAPLSFTRNEKHSFAEWLKLTSLKPIERDDKTAIPTEVEDEERSKRMERIDLFLEQRPRIRPTKTPQTSVNLADLNPAPDQLMTQTLAQVYLAQKNYAKAIQAYEILVLQHPEKSGFFADRIREIKNLQSNS